MRTPADAVQRERRRTTAPPSVRVGRNATRAAPAGSEAPRSGTRVSLGCAPNVHFLLQHVFCFAPRLPPLPPPFGRSTSRKYRKCSHSEITAFLHASTCSCGPSFVRRLLDWDGAGFGQVRVHEQSGPRSVRDAHDPRSDLVHHSDHHRGELRDPRRWFPGGTSAMEFCAFV